MSAYRARFVVLAMAAALGGCATNNPRDPFEPYNRAVYAFNDRVDRYALKPVAEGYRAAVPALVRTGVRNFFANLEDVWIGANNLLQGKVGEWANDWLRFAVNTVVGLGGVLDIASASGMEKHNEDFGQTLGRWGVPAGPYLVLPLLGPRTARDAAAIPLEFYGTQIGRLADWATSRHEVAFRNSLYGLDLVRVRAGLLDATNILEQAALDPYRFSRDAYLQRRLDQVYDGNPPRRRYDEDDESSLPIPPSAGTAAVSRAAVEPAGELASGEAEVALPPVDRVASDESGTSTAGAEPLRDGAATTARATVSGMRR